MEEEIEIPIDSIVEEVRGQLLNRAKYGYKKYNTNLDRRDLSVDAWINNAIEEALDFALYLTKLKKELKDGTK